MDKFKKLNEAISELGWDAYFIKNEKSSFIEGAIIGNHMLVSHLTEEKDIDNNATTKDIDNNTTTKYIDNNATTKYIDNNAITKDIDNNTTTKDIDNNAITKDIDNNATTKDIDNNTIKKLNLINDDKKINIDDIYHKMILVSDTGFWITEIDSNGSVDYKIYNNEDAIISQVSEAIMSSKIDIKTFNDNIKIMSNYPYCINLYNSDKIVMFPSEEICEKSFQKMEESIKV
jgi:hypothetical protein